MEINARLKMYCGQKGITYIDLVPVFVDASGKLSKRYSIDGLHLNGEGYLKWASLIRMYVEGR